MHPANCRTMAGTPSQDAAQDAFFFNVRRFRLLDIGVCYGAGAGEIRRPRTEGSAPTKTAGMAADSRTMNSSKEQDFTNLFGAVTLGICKKVPCESFWKRLIRQEHALKAVLSDRNFILSLWGKN